MTHYVAPTLIFLSVVIALVGPVRDESGAITAVGWGTALVASLSFVASIATQYVESRKWEAIRKHAHDLVTPHLLTLYDIVDFVFVLHYLEQIPPDPDQTEPLASRVYLQNPFVRVPERLTMSRTSDEWLHALEAYNFLPRRGFSVEETMKARDPRRLPVADDLEQIAGVPFAGDSRLFHQIVTARATEAVGEIKSALLAANLQSYDGNFLRAIQSLLKHRFVLWMIEFEGGIEKFIKVDGRYAEDNGKVSLVHDGETSYACIGPGREVYVEFIETLGQLLRSLGATQEREQIVGRYGSLH